MPKYIRFDKKPDTIGAGRTARNITYKRDTLADWVGEVDEVFEGETELDKGAAEALGAENAEHNDRLPLPVAPPPMPSRLDRLVNAIAADKNIEASTKAAITALKDG